jgi:hypothetical protein
MPPLVYCYKLGTVLEFACMSPHIFDISIDEGGEWLSGVHLALSAVPFKEDPVCHSHYCCVGVSSS